MDYSKNYSFKKLATQVLERMKRVAIIGSAGRDKDEGKFTLELFEKMKEEVVKQITEEWKLETKNVILVSGGSAWSDHVAVSLYKQDPNKWGGLHLYLPCKFPSKGKYYTTLKELHSNMKCNSMDDFDLVKKMGAVFDTSVYGFLQRNTLVAKHCDYMIAFTWNMFYPKYGGTGDTWSKCKGVKKHIPLSVLLKPKQLTFKCNGHMFPCKRKITDQKDEKVDKKFKCTN